MVLTVNQASGWVDDVSFHYDRADAVEVAASMAAETEAVGRRERHYVAKVEDWVQIDGAGQEHDDG